MTDRERDLHSMKGVEDAMRKNVTANVDYSKETRLMFRELEEEVKSLRLMVQTMQGQMINVQQQIGVLHQRTLAGGPTA